jgi:hypothetical protein
MAWVQIGSQMVEVSIGESILLGEGFRAVANPSEYAMAAKFKKIQDWTTPSSEVTC